MNYLAHAYLSFGDEDVLLGNMISDFVKGRKQYDFPPGIYKGILVHRAIDQFTDTHPATREAKQFFQQDYRLYSGAIMDVIYDYFLANDPLEFPPGALLDFSQHTYQLLENHYEWMPTPFQQMFGYMKAQNWLLGYGTREGIFKSLDGLVHRARYLSDSQPAKKIFDTHIERLADCYRHLWTDLKPFINTQFYTI